MNLFYYIFFFILNNFSKFISNLEYLLNNLLIFKLSKLFFLIKLAKFLLYYINIFLSLKT